MHHYGSSFDFIQGSGAELRTSFVRKPLPLPYGLVVNGSAVSAVGPRMTNIQLINTSAATRSTPLRILTFPFSLTSADLGAGRCCLPDLAS